MLSVLVSWTFFSEHFASIREEEKKTREENKRE